MTHTHQSEGDLRLFVNGNALTTTASTVRELLVSLSLAPETVVVEVNGVIVQREAFGPTRLHADDTLEILHFVGGG